MSRLFVIMISVSVFVFTQTAHAQEHAPLPIKDSLLLQRYIDSINSVPFFSHRRQLYYDSALTIKPWKASWWQQKAMPLFKQKKYEVGLPFLDSAVKYDTKRYIDYRAFMKCIFQKSYREAIKDFEAAKTIIGPGSVMDHSYDFYIGLCYLQLNKFDSSEFYLVKTIGQQRSSMGSKWVNPLDWFYLGIVYYEQDNYTRAIAAFDSSLNVYNNFSDAKFYKAICIGRLGDSDQQRALMKEAGNDFSKGFTINEDNAIHEPYPYQVSQRSFK